MNIGSLKKLIKDVPDDYLLQIEIDIHSDDISDVLVERLIVKKTEAVEKSRCFRVTSGLWNASRSSAEVNNS